MEAIRTCRDINLVKVPLVGEGEIFINPEILMQSSIRKIQYLFYVVVSGSALNLRSQNLQTR